MMYRALAMIRYYSALAMIHYFLLESSCCDCIAQYPPPLSAYLSIET